MASKLKIFEQICGSFMESEIKAFKEGGFYRVEVNSNCPYVQLFSKKLKEMKWSMEEIYNLNLYKMWITAKSFGVKPFCPIPTAVMNAIWFEAGLIAESVALTTKTKFNLKKDDRKTIIELEIPICGYTAIIVAESTPAGTVKLSVEIPCPDVNKYMKDIEKKRIRDLNNCDEIYQQSEITDEKTCYIPLAICIAYAIQSKKVNVLDEQKPVIEISMAKIN